jgi:hypothetical protein
MFERFQDLFHKVIEWVNITYSIFALLFLVNSAFSFQLLKSFLIDLSSLIPPDIIHASLLLVLMGFCLELFKKFFMDEFSVKVILALIVLIVLSLYLSFSVNYIRESQNDKNQDNTVYFNKN